jgi:hypothetical protein
LLKLAYNFAKLDKNVREKYADPVSRYRYSLRMTSRKKYADSYPSASAGHTERYIYLLHPLNTFNKNIQEIMNGTPGKMN